MALKAVLVAACAFLLLTLHTLAAAIEEPKFTVVRQLADNVEVREYAPYIVAEVVVPGPAGDAGSQGFKRLAAYIFGKNKGERTMAMTAPVTQTTEPQKIAMAAPVTQSATDGGYLVQFVMPADSTLETLPAPIDPEIHLKAETGGRYAVIRYSGFWSDGNYQTHLDVLRATLAAAGVETTGEPIYSRYDAPWIPWFMRRNEIWLRLN